MEQFVNYARRLPAIHDINALYDHAEILAISLIKSEARKILQDDSDLDEFIMAMGSCTFTTKKGVIVSPLNKYNDFFEMVYDLDDKFKCMGYSVRFTANSEEKYTW
jgi:hypothetical protein